MTKSLKSILLSLILVLPFMAIPVASSDAITEERIQEIMNTYLRGNYSVSGPDMWEAAQKISNEGKVYLCHNKKMREVFNMKMREFAVYDEKFLTLIKK